jgi:hypothetical protein
MQQKKFPIILKMKNLLKSTTQLCKKNYRVWECSLGAIHAWHIQGPGSDPQHQKNIKLIRRHKRRLD